MKQSRLWVLAAAIFLLPLLASGQQIQIESVSGQDASAHEALVKLQPWAPSPAQVMQPYNPETVQQIGRAGWIRLKSYSLDATSLLAALRLDPQIAFAEPNYIIHSTDTVPNDPDFSSLWGLQNTGQIVEGQTGAPFADISAVKAWDIARGSAAVTVGVVDSGIDYTHPDLAANVWTAQKSYQIVLGDTTYTCPAGSHGFNAEMLSCDPFDDNTHGTHVSGTIGAQGNNLLGVTGVNWRTSIAAFKFLNLYGLGSVADAINAIEAAIQLQAQGVNIRVLSNSWSSGTYSDALLQTVNDANTANMLFVAAAGNDSASNDQSPQYPAAYNAPNLIAVAATDNQDNLASFSNYGPTTVHLGAPGVNILSTFLSPNYGYLSGTSMATPHVSGAAALLLSKCSLTTSELKTAILSTVDPIPSLAGLTITGGRLNVFHALNYCGATASPDFTMSATPAVLSVAPGGSASTQISIADFSGFNDIVNLSVSGLPSGVTASLFQTSITGAGSAMLTLTTSAATIPGTYLVTVSGSSGSLAYPVVIQFIVKAPDFTLSAAPASVGATPGSSANAMVTVAALNGFTGVVTLTASGIPTGVTASFAPTSLNGSGASALAFTVAANTVPGVYAITITGASGATLSHTAPLSLVVNAAPNFTLSAYPASVNAIAGGSVVSTLTISSLNGFSGAVSLTASGMPAGVTASFAPASVTGSGTSVLTFTTANSTAAGTYPIVVQAVSGNLTHTATLSLTVSVPDFTLSASPTAVVLPPNGSAASTIAVGALNGFAGPVSLAAIGLPAGVTASFSPPIVNNGSGSATLTLLASASAPAGVFTVTVQGANGNLKHTVPLTVTLEPTFLLLANVSVLPGSSIPFPVTLAAPAASTVFVSLTSSDTTKLTITPANVLIQAGSTAPSSIPRLTGVSYGSASITASAWNYAPATQAVQVADSLSFFPTSLTLSQGAAQNLTLTIAAPLPSALTVNLSSANAAVAAMPATVTFSANATSVSVPITGVGAGSTIIHASALPAFPDTTAAITVGAGLSILTTALAGGQVNSPYSQTLTATGGTPPLTWTLISGALPTGLKLGSAGQIGGTPTVTATNVPLTFKVTDAGSPPQTATTTLTLTIAPSGPSPASIAAAKGTPQSVTVNSSFTVPLTALVKDSGGNPLSGVAVSFTAPSSGATGSFATGAMATIVTDATGSASASFTANPVAGSYTVNASVPGVASPALFSLTNLAGPPARISATSGSGQSTSINTPFNNLLVAMVQDAVGNAVSGVTVMFAAPVSGASGTFSGSTTIATNAAGIATAPTFQANSIGGTYQVSATAAGVANPATFALTNSSGIVLPAAVTVQPGLSTPYPIELGAPAPAGGVFIALASSNTATITVTPLSVLIPAGSTTPTVIPRVTGINLGSANISASAWTYQTVSQQASVTDALSFYPSAATVSAGASLFVTLTLFAPLPASLTVSLSSSNPAIATAPSTVTLPANTTSQTIRLTGLVSGSTNITASSPSNVMMATINLTVR